MFSFFKKPTYMVDFAKPFNAEAISLLHGKHFAHGWSRDDIHAMILSQAHVCLVVRPSKGGAAYGFVIVRVTLDEAEILTIAVAKSLQGKGFGRQLLHKTLPLLAQRQVKKLFLEVASDNLAALTLYKAQGFTTVSTRKNYYQERGVAKDAFVMMRLI